jgi:hypothetical protein
MRFSQRAASTRPEPMGLAVRGVRSSAQCIETPASPHLGQPMVRAEIRLNASALITETERGEGYV